VCQVYNLSRCMSVCMGKRYEISHWRRRRRRCTSKISINLLLA
jgi:hypothetical protein